MELNMRLEELDNGFLIIATADGTRDKNKTYVEYAEFPEGGYFINRRDCLTSYKFQSDKDHGPQAYGGKTEDDARRMAREIASGIIRGTGVERYWDLVNGECREVLVAENMRACRDSDYRAFDYLKEVFARAG
jgi:hypothetical protein